MKGVVWAMKLNAKFLCRQLVFEHSREYIKCKFKVITPVLFVGMHHKAYFASERKHLREVCGQTVQVFRRINLQPSTRLRIFEHLYNVKGVF